MNDDKNDIKPGDFPKDLNWTSERSSSPLIVYMSLPMLNVKRLLIGIIERSEASK